MKACIVLFCKVDSAKTYLTHYLNIFAISESIFSSILFIIILCGTSVFSLLHNIKVRVCAKNSISLLRFLDQAVVEKPVISWRKVMEVFADF